MAAEDYFDLMSGDYDFDPDPCPHSDECREHGRPVIRTNRATGERFLGCSAFPRCRWTCNGGYPFDDHPFARAISMGE